MTPFPPAATTSLTPAIPCRRTFKRATFPAMRNPQQIPAFLRPFLRLACLLGALALTSGLPAQPGGGSPAKGSANAAPNLVANVKAPNVQVDGADMSAGKPQGAMLEARGLTDQRFAGGLSGRTEAENVGAAQGESTNQASASAPAGPAVGVRNAGVAGTEGVKAMNDSTGGPFVKSESMAAPRNASGGNVEIPAGSAAVESARDSNPGADAGSLARAMPATTVADIAALEGPGGLGDHIASQAGIDRRATHSDEPEIRFAESRFVRRDGGGVPRVSTTAVAAAGAYQRRVRERKTNDGPADENDAAIERGLSYLARQQRPDGSWSLAVGNESTILSSDVAATGLALLAFHGANYNHRQDKYQDQVRAGLDFLVRNQREDGDLFLPADDQSNQSVWLYSHSIAALALSEAYGMTQDPALREPAQKALQFIVGAQHPQRGGWRYAPGVGADTSVSGWMTMALESGKRAGLQVPDTVYVGMQRWLDAGIDHILVDEAQDTSPAQWEILRRLADEFASGAGARAAARTLFAVGDEKQSIYSFQGARPESFAEMKAHFKRRADAANGE